MKYGQRHAQDPKAEPITAGIITCRKYRTITQNEIPAHTDSALGSRTNTNTEIIYKTLVRHQSQLTGSRLPITRRDIRRRSNTSNHCQPHQIKIQHTHPIQETSHHKSQVTIASRVAGESPECRSSDCRRRCSGQRRERKS
jgi:hypothetical protein